MPTSANNKGFTLIEIVIVVALVGIVFAAVAQNLNPTRFFNLGYDDKRKDSINKLRSALASYYLDKSAYPAASCDGDGDAATATCCSSWQSYIDGLNPKYISVLPHDPEEPTSAGPPDFCYSRGTSDTSGYKLEFRLSSQETGNTKYGEYLDSATASNGKTYYRYRITENWNFP